MRHRLRRAARTSIAVRLRVDHRRVTVIRAVMGPPENAGTLTPRNAPAMQLPVAVPA
ncbi:MAG: hypothetical protein JRI23_07455 [Deltaproteobacteria bacterium]|nr:hypothetical protein [Deltaproteobacteria bacterium]